LQNERQQQTTKTDVSPGASHQNLGNGKHWLELVSNDLELHSSLSQMKTQLPAQPPGILNNM
jgi:hypothetical protein